MSTSELRKDIGRLLWVGFEGTELDDRLRDTLSAGDAGGVTLFARNLPKHGDETDVLALRRLNDELHEAGRASGEKLLISVDQEGGRVQRIKAPAKHYPPMLSVAPGSDEEALAAVRALGGTMGAELAQWGFDIDFAPVLDVHTNPANPIIGDRAFGEKPESAAKRALAFADGLQDAGILPCGKHFPGHGDTATDSHLALPRLDHDMGRLGEIELAPFVSGIAANIPMLMTAHVVFAALDATVPATLSKTVITGLLRDELGYEGVVISDDLDMRAIADNYGVGDAAIRAVHAGCDVLLLCRNLAHQEEARGALFEKARGDAAFRKRISGSAARVRRLSSLS
ncbi:MAG: beta-N-acetylhexosaminidase [Myxococcales bacterium]|nr:beta-N-acetylhexosaminidase [Myxococcales bacterium]